jgi:ribosomal protein L31E
MKVDRTFNEAAWKRGAEAANNVDLKISTEVKRKKAGELK